MSTTQVQKDAKPFPSLEVHVTSKRLTLGALGGVIFKIQTFTFFRHSYHRIFKVDSGNSRDRALLRKVKELQHLDESTNAYAPMQGDDFLQEITYSRVWFQRNMILVGILESFVFVLAMI